MSQVNDFLAKLGDGIKQHQSDLIIAGVVVVITLISFQAGRSYQAQSNPTDTAKDTTNLAGLIQVGEPGSNALPSQPVRAGDRIATTKPTPLRTDLRVVASKNSKTNKKYHYLWCPGAKRIIEANRIYFASAGEAKAQGYALAGNCTR